MFFPFVKCCGRGTHKGLTYAAVLLWNVVWNCCIPHFEKGGRGGICSLWCAIQAFSNPPDGTTGETTSHLTRLSNNDSQVAGYHSPFSKGETKIAAALGGSRFIGPFEGLIQ